MLLDLGLMSGMFGHPVCKLGDGQREADMGTRVPVEPKSLGSLKRLG